MSSKEAKVGWTMVRMQVAGGLFRSLNADDREKTQPTKNFLERSCFQATEKKKVRSSTSSFFTRTKVPESWEKFVDYVERP